MHTGSSREQKHACAAAVAEGPHQAVMLSSKAEAAIQEADTCKQLSSAGAEH